MALPTVAINNSTGSNTQASGAGPATAVYGSAGSVTNGSGSVSITDAVDISGVATDGSAVLYIATSSGRKFSKITAISGSSGAWTVTVEDTVWTTGSSLSWAIGGKRLDFETTNSNTKQLFADAKPGWTIDLQQTGTNYTVTSTITLSASGDTATGPITLTSTSGTRPILTSATNSVALLTGSGSGWVVDRIKCTHTATTRGAGIAWSGNVTNWRVQRSIFDGCLRGISTTTSANACHPLSVIDCEIANCTAASAGAIANFGNTFVMGCYIHDNASIPCIVSDQITTNRVLVVMNSILVNSTYGIRINSNSATTTLIVTGCTIAGNTSGGIDDANRTSTFLVLGLANNVIYGNTGYGVSTAQTQAATEYQLMFNRHNAYGANSSGNLSNVPAGIGDVSLSGNPFTNSGSGDYSLDNTSGEGAACRAAGFPGAFVGGTTTSYADIGAAQHQDAGGSTYYGPSLARIVNAGGV